MQTTTYQATPSAFPNAWIDLLFDRLAAMYGKAWFDCWADVPMADVKNAWRNGLSKFSAEALRRGLERCQTECKFAPSMPEFAALCVAAPQAHERHRFLDAPRYSMPPQAREAMGQFTAADRKGDKREWARRILAREAAGEHMHPIAGQFAREALGVAAGELSDDPEAAAERSAIQGEGA